MLGSLDNIDLRRWSGWRYLQCHAILTGSLGMVGVYLLIAAIAPLLFHWQWLRDPTDFLSNPIHQSPSFEYWLGTTREGYDVLSRTLFGTRTALQVVVAGTSLALVFGVPLGLLSGYSGGWLDRVLVFAMDAIYTLPGLLLAIAVAFVLGPGIGTAAVAVALAYGPLYFRVVRNQTASIKARGYVEAAVAAGASPVSILYRHIFPNVLSSLPVLFTLNAADAILITASLGFLGLGLPQDIPEWGQDLRAALDAFAAGSGIWWTAVFPGLAIALLVTALSLVGESFSDETIR